MDDKGKLHFIAEAGVKRAIVELKKQDPTSEEFSNLNEFWSNNPLAFKEIQVGEGNFTVGYSPYFKGVGNSEGESINADSEKKSSIRYGIIDEERKINLNTAEVEILKRLFQNVASLDEESATELAYCIIDWRDEDSNFQHPEYGAEDSYYKNLKHPYKTKNAEYEILEELLLVKGMNNEIFDKAKDYLTVFGEGQININTASEEVLSALGLTNELVTKILSFRCGDDLKEATSDDDVFTSSSVVITELKKTIPLDLSEISQLEILIAKKQLTTISENFMIKSTAKLDNRDVTHQIIAIVGSKGEIKYWQEE
jgi:DNA uptake protein ComE-like DNA-binding protein